MSDPLGTLFTQFVTERIYPYNVTQKTQAWYGVRRIHKNGFVTISRGVGAVSHAASMKEAVAYAKGLNQPAQNETSRDRHVLRGRATARSERRADAEGS